MRKNDKVLSRTVKGVRSNNKDDENGSHWQDHSGYGQTRYEDDGARPIGKFGEARYGDIEKKVLWNYSYWIILTNDNVHLANRHSKQNMRPIPLVADRETGESSWVTLIDDIDLGP